MKKGYGSEMSGEQMRVADFFCGAGGFSEGFRQMGFKIAFGLDNWGPAIDTIELNHPGINAVKMNILELNTPQKIDEIVPDVDVIIGSPPCVAFSGSNKAGKADKSPGIQLIENYLRIIAWKLNKPRSILKYWILENVPNSAKYIKDEYSFDDLGLPGGKRIALKISQRNIFNADDYGTPQGRQRFFCGNYPKPKKTHLKNNKIHTSHVLDSLTDPLDGKNTDTVLDPCYGFEISRDDLTDHFYDTTVSEWEWKRAKRLKEDHGYMGKMSFPENLERTSRTIMATRSASTREAILFGGKRYSDGRWKNYRMPTIREIASIMSFPITYQFEANNESSKYRLVGNAVCPLESRALAKAILEKENMDVPQSFIHLQGSPKPTFDLTGIKRKQKEPPKRKLDSRYSRHIPYMKIRGFRVELHNKESNFKENDVHWSVILHQGSGKNALKCECDNEKIKDMLEEYTGFNEFERQIQEQFKNIDVDANSLQKTFCNLSEDGLIGPDRLLSDIKDIVDEYFPEKNYSDEWLDNDNREINIDRDRIPLRILAGHFALNQIIDKVNG
jgi:DNA (cytosine-5)-methyltransferase 1